MKNPQRSVNGQTIVYCRTHTDNVSNTTCTDCGASMCPGCINESQRYGTTPFCPSCLAQMNEITARLGAPGAMRAHLLRMMRLERTKNTLYEMLSVLALVTILGISGWLSYMKHIGAPDSPYLPSHAFLAGSSLVLLALIGFPSAVFFLRPPPDITGCGRFGAEVRRIKLKQDSLFSCIVRDASYALPKLALYPLFRQVNFLLCVMTGVAFALINPFRLHARAKRHARLISEFPGDSLAEKKRVSH